MENINNNKTKETEIEIWKNLNLLQFTYDPISWCTEMVISVDSISVDPIFMPIIYRNTPDLSFCGFSVRRDLHHLEKRVFIKEKSESI